MRKLVVGARRSALHVCFLTVVAGITTEQAAEAVTIDGCGDNTDPIYNTPSLPGSQEIADCLVVSMAMGNPLIDAVEFDRAGAPNDSISMVGTDFYDASTFAGGVTAYAFTHAGFEPGTANPLDYYIVTGSYEDTNSLEEFCCVIIEDTPGEVTGIGLAGTSDSGDSLSLNYGSGHNLEPLGSELYGETWLDDGDDGSFGSNSQSEGYHETLNGGSGRDFLVGNNGDDTLYGNGGDDLLLGGYGADTVFGGDGDDLIVGDEENSNVDDRGDVLSGGEDDDEICTGSDAGIFIPTPTTWALDCDATGINNTANFNIASGNAGDDLIIGTGSWDKMSGGLDDDDLFGNGNVDWFDAGSGVDTLTGSSGAEWFCILGSGDTVTGSGGDDHITSDSGASWAGVDMGAGGNDTCAGSNSPNHGCDTDLGSFPACTL